MGVLRSLTCNKIIKYKEEFILCKSSSHVDMSKILNDARIDELLIETGELFSKLVSSVPIEIKKV